jgi:hypothetical protein
MNLLTVESFGRGAREGYRSAPTGVRRVSTARKRWLAVGQRRRRRARVASKLLHLHRFWEVAD